MNKQAFTPCQPILDYKKLTFGTMPFDVDCVEKTANQILHVIAESKLSVKASLVMLDVLKDVIPYITNVAGREIFIDLAEKDNRIETTF